MREAAVKLGLGDEILAYWLKCKRRGIRQRRSVDDHHQGNVVKLAILQVCLMNLSSLLQLTLATYVSN